MTRMPCNTSSINDIRRSVYLVMAARTLRRATAMKNCAVANTTKIRNAMPAGTHPISRTIMPHTMQIKLGAKAPHCRNSTMPKMRSMSTDRIVINWPVLVLLLLWVDNFMAFRITVFIRATRNAMAAQISWAQPCCMVIDMRAVSNDNNTARLHGGQPLNTPSTTPFSKYRKMARINKGWRVYVTQYPTIHKVHQDHVEPKACHNDRNKYHVELH